MASGCWRWGWRCRAGWHQWHSGGRYVTVVTVQNNTLGLGSAMGEWNCYTVTVTQGVSNPNDQFGVNGIVATVAAAQGVSNPVEEPFWGRCGVTFGSEP